MVPGLTDERLCWLAVEKHLHRASQKLGLFGWLTVLASGRAAQGASGLAGDMRRGGASEKKADYAVAVDIAATRLSPEERAHLRATGEVPDWFTTDIDGQVQTLRKQR